MEVITARNINSAWDDAKILLNARHVARPSRVGDVWEYNSPVTTEYLNPTERVLFNPERNASPIFHFMESLWMLAGREDVEWVSQFNPRMKEFSDDGVKFHGAYGYRWRRAFDLDGGAEDDYADQLQKVVRMLKKNPDERRAVVTMWNPLWDLERPDVKDLPCNLSIAYKIREGRLTQTVFCRSNDIAWGAYGSNCVHFSMLQEYLAGMVGVPVGTYWQISDSWHAYTERWESVGGLSNIPTPDYYQDGYEQIVKPYPMVTVGAEDVWDEELQDWMQRSVAIRDLHITEGFYDNRFFPQVATPLLLSWKAYKFGNLQAATEFAKKCAASDWSLAAQQWYMRIEAKRRAKGA